MNARSARARAVLLARQFVVDAIDLTLPLGGEHRIRVDVVGVDALAEPLLGHVAVGELDGPGELVAVGEHQAGDGLPGPLDVGRLGDGTLVGRQRSFDGRVAPERRPIRRWEVVRIQVATVVEQLRRQHEFDDVDVGVTHSHLSSPGGGISDSNRNVAPRWTVSAPDINGIKVLVTR